MDREPVVGECVVVVRNNGSHPGRVGDRYVISNVDDNDDTIRGFLNGSTSVADHWVAWTDIEPVAYGWEYARQHLPADVVALLSACTGIEHISLNRRIKELIFDTLPDWREQTLEVIGSVDVDSP